MTKNSSSRTLVLIIVFLLASFSCQLFSSGSATDVALSTAASSTVPVSSSPKAETETTEASPPQTEEPAATQPESTGPQELPPLPPAQPGPESLDLASLPEPHPLTDFSERFRVVMDFTDPDGAAQQLVTDYNFRQTSVPEDAWYKLFEDNNPFISQKVETALVSGQGYTLTDTSACQVVTVEVVDNTGQRQPFTDLIKSLTGQVSLAEAGVMVGDQQADAYTIEDDNFVPGSQVEIKVTTSDESGSSTSTTTIRLTEEDSVMEDGKLFLARQGGYLLRLELQYSRVAGEEDAFLVQTGSTMNRSLTYEVVPAAAVEPIQPPEGCAEMTGDSDDNSNDDDGNENDNDNDNDNDNENDNDNDNGDDTDDVTINDIPRLDDAANVVQAGETLIYQTSQDMQSVLDFYRNELEAAGWEVTDEISLGTLASMELVRGSQTISVTMTQSGSNVMVTIVLE